MVSILHCHLGVSSRLKSCPYTAKSWLATYAPYRPAILESFLPLLATPEMSSANAMMLLETFPVVLGQLNRGHYFLHLILIPIVVVAS